MINVNNRLDDQSDDRSSVRTRILVEASSDAGAGMPIDLVIHDLSATGVLFSADTLFGPQTSITIEIAGIGTMQAKVVWSGGLFQGAEFVSPLVAETVAAMLERSKVVWPAFSKADPKPIQNRDVACSTSVPATLFTDFDEPIRLAPGIKIQIVVSLALLLWAGLTLGALSLIA